MPIKVLVVDDSYLMRKLITDILKSDPEITVVGEGKNGYEAIHKNKELMPDVITLDLQMPILDGLQALQTIMAERPVPVIIISAYTSQEAEITVECLRRGAVDFIPKPGGTVSTEIMSIRDELIRKVKVAAKAKVEKKTPPQDAKPFEIKPKPAHVPARKVIAIGSSTGGPSALETVISQFPRKIGAGVIVVQHMPALFTKSLAARLDACSALSVKEAAEGDEIIEDQVLIAPGGKHLTVVERGGKKVVQLNDGPLVKGVRPSADVMMNSLPAQFGSHIVGIILTGMGDDGSDGMATIKKHGGKLIAQDEKTSVVFGMPKAVIEKGIVDCVLPLDEITKGALELLKTV